jgi:hypothetical protein
MNPKLLKKIENEKKMLEDYDKLSKRMQKGETYFKE